MVDASEALALGLGLALVVAASVASQYRRRQRPRQPGRRSHRLSLLRRQLPGTLKAYKALLEERPDLRGQVVLHASSPSRCSTTSSRPRSSSANVLVLDTMNQQMLDRFNTDAQGRPDCGGPPPRQVLADRRRTAAEGALHQPGRASSTRPARAFWAHSRLQQPAGAAEARADAGRRHGPDDSQAGAEPRLRLLLPGRLGERSACFATVGGVRRVVRSRRTARRAGRAARRARLLQVVVLLRRNRAARRRDRRDREARRRGDSVLRLPGGARRAAAAPRRLRAAARRRGARVAVPLRRSRGVDDPREGRCSASSTWSASTAAASRNGGRRRPACRSSRARFRWPCPSSPAWSRPP